MLKGFQSVNRISF